jgi:hypothetical protein
MSEHREVIIIGFAPRLTAFMLRGQSEPSCFEGFNREGS